MLIRILPSFRNGGIDFIKGLCYKGNLTNRLVIDNFRPKTLLELSRKSNIIRKIVLRQSST